MTGGPMTGVRVVEMGVWIAGPACAGVLGDWGAEVIKIEPPAGDPSRLFRQMLGGDLPSNPVFELDNRNKRSIALDLSTEDGRAVAAELVASADVFVTNVRPGALARAGLDSETMLARSPRLIYGHITGYGINGDDADRAAFDIAAFWSRAGIASLLSPPGGAPPFQRGGMGDHSTGVQFAGAISAALFARERTGAGQLVTTSLLRQGVYTVGFDLNLLLGWGRYPAPAERETMASATINHYLAGDGRRFWLVGLVGDRHWPPLARCVGRADLTSDPRFLTAVDRAIHARDLIAILDEIFLTKSLDEWADIFATEPDMFWSPINTPDDVLADPTVHAAGAFVDVPDGQGGTTMIATPADFHGTPWAPRHLAPSLGEHTREILRELGRTDHAIDHLLTSGAAVTTFSEGSSATS
jgi:crotonobetainyl-CoA:carnitine CoA-transferase CaiB-like acyl-CoA transferase